MCIIKTHLCLQENITFDNLMTQEEDLDYLDWDDVMETEEYQKVYKSLEDSLSSPEEASQPGENHPQSPEPEEEPTPEEQTEKPVPGLLQAMYTCLVQENMDTTALEETGIELFKIILPDLLNLKQSLRCKPVVEFQETASQTEIQKPRPPKPLLDQDVVEIEVSTTESNAFNKQEVEHKLSKTKSGQFYLQALEVNGVQNRKDLLRKFSLKVAKKADRELIQECLEKSGKTFTPKEIKQLGVLMADPLLKYVSYSNLNLEALFKYLYKVTSGMLSKSIDKSKNHQARRNFIRKKTLAHLKLIQKFHARCRRRNIAHRLAM